MPEIDPDILKKLPSSLAENLDKNLCTCMDVPKRVVIMAIANGAHTLQEVKAETTAMMGAKCCEQQVEKLIKCILAPEKRKRRKRSPEN